MNPTELKKLFKNASKSFIEANSGIDTRIARAKPTKPKPDSLQKPVGNNGNEEKSSAGHATRYVVRYQDVRKRLLDTDNATGKWHCDFLRRAGVIPDDHPGICTIEMSQRKCEKGEEPHCLIQVYRLQ